MPTAPRPLSLSDQQLTAVLSAAAPLAPPDRSARSSRSATGAFVGNN